MQEVGGHDTPIQTDLGGKRTGKKRSSDGYEERGVSGDLGVHRVSSMERNGGTICETKAPRVRALVAKRNIGITIPAPAVARIYTFLLSNRATKKGAARVVVHPRRIETDKRRP